MIIDEDDCNYSVYNEMRRESDRYHLETDRLETSRHASISHSLSGHNLGLSLHHSGSRHSLASKSLSLSQEKKVSIDQSDAT